MPSSWSQGLVHQTYARPPRFTFQDTTEPLFYLSSSDRASSPSSVRLPGQRQGDADVPMPHVKKRWATTDLHSAS